MKYSLRDNYHSIIMIKNVNYLAFPQQKLLRRIPLEALLGI